MDVIATPELWIIIGIMCIVSWLVLLAFRKQKMHQEAEIEIKESVGHTLVRQGDTMNLPEIPNKFDENMIKNKLQVLAHQPQNQTALAHYVNGIVERHRSKVNISIIKKWLEEADVQISLINKVTEGKQADAQLRRVEREEELKDTQLETQILKEKTEQDNLLRHKSKGGELEDLRHEYEVRKLKKKVAELDKEEEKSVDPVEQERVIVRIETEKQKIRRQAKRELDEENRIYIENQKRMKMIQLAPSARNGSYENFQIDVEEKYGNRADYILEEYQKFVDDLESRHS